MSGPSSSASQDVHKQEVGLEVEHLESESDTLIRDVGIPSIGLTCTTRPVCNNNNDHKKDSTAGRD